MDKYNLLLTSKSLDRDEIYPCPQPKCSGYGLKIDNKTYCCQNSDCQFMFCGSCRAASHTGACEKPFLTIGKTVEPSVQTVYRISLKKVAVSTLNVSVILKSIGGVVKQLLLITDVQAAL